MNSSLLAFEPTNLVGQEMMEKVLDTIITILVQHIRLETEYCKKLKINSPDSDSEEIKKEITYYNSRISEMAVIASYLTEMGMELYGDKIAEAKRLSGTPDRPIIDENFTRIVCYPDWGSDFWISEVEKNAKSSWFLSCVYDRLKYYIIYEQNRWREGSEASKMKNAEAFRDAANDVGGLLLGIVHSWLMKARAADAGIDVPNEEITETMLQEMVSADRF